MLVELVSTLALGFGAAGIVLLLNRLLGRRLPRWSLPAAIAFSVIGYQVWLDYSWFGRTAAALPEGMEVTVAVDEPAPWRPWSYFFPQIVRFAAIDAGGARRHEGQPDLRIADLYLFQRRGPAVTVPQLYDCGHGRRADLGDGVAFGPDGAPQGAVWTDLAPDDAALRALCPTP
ncbi:MAG TPA: hypothetical protein VFR34_00355 [Paracoccaceae bacterium]|nr:hypothetical protein [Paracoccaceae bacterium]